MSRPNLTTTKLAWYLRSICFWQGRHVVSGGPAEFHWSGGSYALLAREIRGQ